VTDTGSNNRSDTPANGPRVLVVIVNYRSAELTAQCLRSLAGEVTPQVTCTVVDNASGDGSAERIAAAIEAGGWAWAHLLPLERNGGFAFGNNAAIRAALAKDAAPDYVWLLNPDTIVQAGALAALVGFLSAHPQAGIAGSKLLAEDGSAHSSARRFPSVLSELEAGMRLGVLSRLLANRVVAIPPRDECHEADWVPGASMCIRREVFESIGLFDEAYFLYFEEVDFCLRARRAGWSCWYVPESRVVHLTGRTTGVTDPARRPGRLPEYWFESRQRYFSKNHGPLTALLANAARTLGLATYRARSLLQRKPPTDPPRLLWDFIRFNVRALWKR